MSAAPPVPTAAPASPKSKTLAAWLAFLGGALGLHRFYLHGLRDPLGWLHLPLTALGLWGVQRMDLLGQDDRLAWLLIPLLGLSLALGMGMACRIGLTPDERWDARFRPAGPPGRSGWGVVFAVIGALMVGAAVLMASIAFASQRYFEWQIESARELSQ